MKRNSLGRGDEAVSPVVAVILMIAITVILAAIVYLIATKTASDQPDDSPEMTLAFDADDDGAGGILTVSKWTGDKDITWDEITIQGTVDTVGTTDCTFPTPTATVEAGQEIDCRQAESGETVSFVYEPTNAVVTTFEFP